MGTTKIKIKVNEDKRTQIGSKFKPRAGLKTVRMSVLGTVRNGLRLTATNAVVKGHMAPIVIGCRTMLSKARRGEYERPKPYPHETKDFNRFAGIYDRTTVRMDENSRIILVDGAHAVGKTDFAKQLAEEFDMKCLEYPSLSNYYINYYGEDLQDYGVYMPDMFKPYDERDFSRNPTGPVEGSGDRFHLKNWVNKFRNYIRALKHLYSTGQGVVVEGNPWSDYAHLEAAYNQRWIDRTTRNAIKDSYNLGLYMLLRPHVVVYLDASVDAVMKNVKERNNPWDKDSPVWFNKRYLNDIYNEKKRRYLMDKQRHSHVLVYDWATPGDLDVVVDDLEKLELDYTEEYDSIGRDWTARRSEKRACETREWYCRADHRRYMESLIMDSELFLDCPQLFYDVEDAHRLQAVLKNIKSERWAPGVNPYMGDKNIMLNCSTYTSAENIHKIMTNRENQYFWMISDPVFPWQKQDSWLEPVKAQK